MSDKQPEALRLASILRNDYDTYYDQYSALEAAKELYRLHDVNIELLEALQAVIKAEPKYTYRGISMEELAARDLAIEVIAKATGDYK